MFGHARRSYRVYAEDDFLGAEDPERDGAASPSDAGAIPSGRGDPLNAGRSLDGASFDGMNLDGEPSYLAPRRALPGTLGGRLAVALLALVAMALSALVVHALRAGLAGGAAAPRPAAVAASSPALSSPSSRGGFRAETGGRSAGAHVGSPRASVRSLVPARESAPRRARARRVAVRRAFGEASVVSGSRAPAIAIARAAGARIEVAPPASSTSEFGFEGRWR